MDKEILIKCLNNIENKGVYLSLKSFECGAHTSKESALEKQSASEAFFDAIKNLREIILTEGV